MIWKTLLLSMACFGLFGSQAHAVRPALDPLGRLHVGASYTDGLGLGVGYDSRLTNLIWVDVGAFMTTTEPHSDLTEANESGDDTWMLRHSIYLAPGWRLPHQQPESIQWDIFARAGFSTVWAADSASDYVQVSNMGLFTGGEFLVKSGKVGLRLSGKLFYFKPYSKTQRVEATVYRPQYGAEAIYQF